MMKFELKREIPSLAMILLPFIYLTWIWSDLPQTVPTHWNISGEADSWGNKNMLIIVPFILPVLIYVVFLLIQQIDPKDRIQKMGRKFSSLKFITTVFMSVLAVFIIYSASSGELASSSILFVILGLLFASLGNFMKTIRPNYFVGIRTPWTLEHETVWKKTHEMAGKYWFIGGLIIALIALITPFMVAAISMIAIVVLITIIPVIYSYQLTKKLKSNS